MFSLWPLEKALNSRTLPREEPYLSARPSRGSPSVQNEGGSPLSLLDADIAGWILRKKDECCSALEGSSFALSFEVRQLEIRRFSRSVDHDIHPLSQTSMVQRSYYLPGEKAARGEIESSNRDLRLTTLCFPLEPGSERIPHDHLLGMNLSAFKFWGTTPLVLPGNSTYSICLLSFHRNKNYCGSCLERERKVL